jgi:ATP-dependent helicase/nuclease subunit A
MNDDPAVIRDAEAQQRRAADPAASVWVSASAGTGKTKVLTDRVLGLMLAGTPPERILCLTFTRAAAAEMAERVAEILGKWATKPDGELARAVAALTGTDPGADSLHRARRLFVRVLDAPGGLNIRTIHAFCQSLLRRFPLEAGIAPHFALMEERDADELLITAREEVLARAQAGGSAALTEALAVITDHVRESTFSDLLGRLASARGRLRRLLDAGGADAAAARIYRRLGVKPGETRESIFAAAARDDAFGSRGLKSALGALSAGSKTDQERAAVIAAWLAAANSDERARGFDAYANAYLTAGRDAIRKTLITKEAAAAAPETAELLASEAQRVLAAFTRLRAAITAQASAAVLRFAEALLESYQRHKGARAALDYDDLILQAGHLLHAPGVAPWVLYKLDGGIDHILIDEAQDTSPDQWRVVDALAAEFFAGAGAREVERSVFAVGDVKQSIYSFQGADPAAFAAMRDMFAAKVAAAEREWRNVDLTISFRSAPAVLRAVDHVFAAHAARDGVTLDGTGIAHQASRAGAAGLVELWPPVEPRKRDEPPPWKPPIERVPADAPQTRLAGLIARRIERMIRDGEILSSKGRPIAAGDITVLVRRRTGFVEDLVRELKRLEIGVAGTDRMVLTEQMAVMDLMALGHFLLLPEDDLTLATVLKGPILGLTEEQLFDLAYGRKGSLWRELGRRAAHGGAFAAAHETLSELSARADFVPPFELFADILGYRRGREKLLARLGPDADDPIAEFLALAQSYERRHVPSLQGFLYWLEAGEVEIKRDLEVAPDNAVRVMTVHGAKGLQAPIVFLPDTMQTPAVRPPYLFWLKLGEDAPEALLWPPARSHFETLCESELDRLAAEQEREYRRLLYVAMTRAEDRLYVCGWQTKNAPPEGCWYHLIRGGLDGIANEIDDPFLADAGETAGATILRVESPQTDEPGESTEPPLPAGLKALPDWARVPAPVERGVPEPLVPSRPTDEEPAALSPLGTDDGVRFRRGRLIHSLLQTLPEVPPEHRAAAAKRYLASAGRDLGDEVRADIAAETMAVIAAPEHAAIFGPGSRAEVSIVGEVAGHVLSGQIDRLVVSGEAVTIVDYKSNRPPPETVEGVPAVYLSQLSAYRAALAKIYGDRPIRCALLWTAGPAWMEIPDALLDRYAP